MTLRSSSATSSSSAGEPKPSQDAEASAASHLEATRYDEHSAATSDIAEALPALERATEPQAAADPSTYGGLWRDVMKG